MSDFPLAVDCSVHHKYPKVLNIPLLNTEYDAVYIPRKTMLAILFPIDTETIEVSNIWWT